MDKGYFRLEVNHINRDTKNVVASASYRSDEQLYSERTDENIKFKNHVVKPESMILTPQNAPSWASDRETLWNEVDKVEKQNSKTQSPRLATEVLISLPNDLDREVQTEMTKDYVQSEFVDKGMVADISIHRDDINNPHAHVLLTTRPFNEDQSWGKKSISKYRFDENGNHILTKSGNKSRETVRFSEFDKEKMNQIRENWANKLNYYSQREQSLRQYDHRSFEKQGLNKIAEIPLTQEEYRLEQKEKKRCEKAGETYEPITYYAQKNEQIRRYNQGEISQIYTDEEKEKAQKEINLFVNKANQLVREDEESYKEIKNRYKHDVGYVEAKETLKKMFNNASTFGRKIQNDIEKNQIEKSYWKFIAEKIDNDKEYRKEILDKGYTLEQYADRIQNRFSTLLEEENNLEKKEEKRQSIYNSAKKVFDTEIEKNNIIVQQMYPTTHNQFNNDEKAFIVQEAHKGNIISAPNVQKLFKESDSIPSNVLMRDSYEKASKDIFFSQQKLKNLNQDSPEYFVESTFIEQRKNEIQTYKEHIDDDLLNNIGQSNYEKVKDQSPNEKVQLMIKLDRYNNVPTEEVINKHTKDLYQNKQSNNEKHKQEQDNTQQKDKVMRSQKVDLTQFLSFYANEMERGNQQKPKKRKKKNQQQANNYHL
ncbi:MobA/MobL family protein [Staphylococcus xylosus]|uniref:MobA/MobL family protein n=1 Tax=Staphylococcus xylosus TaxID=1288 RepID=A0AAQ0LV16_STAXY|nr:MobA/MobL family protein [Staphylococcus xylosus]RIM64115.1 MobA/MobL family protein [Staphylococcus xylosus]RIM90631.1 MobA/MobL family protein [Staphylococcus xylosus]